MAADTRVSRAFPAIAWWVSNQGWIEIGDDDYSHSFVRALDPGGMVWEGLSDDASLDEALAALETALAAFICEKLKVDLTGKDGDAKHAEG